METPDVSLHNRRISDESSEVNDLVVNAGERALLWHSLRERAQNAQMYQADLPSEHVPPEILERLLGMTPPPRSAES